jgi:hypothetical protein
VDAGERSGLEIEVAQGQQAEDAGRHLEATEGLDVLAGSAGGFERLI